MAKLRYVKAPVAQSAKHTGIRHSVRSIRTVYETEPEIARALLPKPLELTRPEIFIQFAHVEMHFPDDRTVTVGAATVGVACVYDDVPGHYVLAMPMEGEFVVIGGRERYGEPKKIAQTEFSNADGKLNAKVSRHGVTFLELNGTVGAPSDGEKQFTEYFYCYKALPAIKPTEENGGFDGDPLLTRLIWERNYDSLHIVDDPEIILREAPRDPLVDVPVKRILRMEYAEGATRTGGEVVRSVPGAWLEPFLCQRYDDPQPGVEIALASEEA